MTRKTQKKQRDKVRQRSIKRSKRRSVMKNISKNKKNKSIKKNKSKKRKKKSHKKIKQKGGSMIAAAGVGTAVLSGLAMAAYAGFKLINKITDKDIVKNLLDAIVIEYLPPVEVLKDKELMTHYLQCVSKVQLFSLILNQKDLLKSKSLTNIIEDVSQTDKNVSDLKETFNHFDKDIQESYFSNEELLPVNIKPSRKYRDGPLHDLSNYIFETSEIFSKNISICVKNVSWYEVIMNGRFGENKQFEIDVDELLKDRKSYEFIDKIEMNNLLSRHKDNPKLRECLFNKMLQCCTKSRGITDYIRGNITFDSSNKCIQCPDEDCLIYIHEFYYEYLLEENDIPVINKIYMLILCEARMCILSKCICLEAIRIQDERLGKVEDILFKIYELDETRNQLYSLPRDVVSGVVTSEPIRQYSMKGGGDYNEGQQDAYSGSDPFSETTQLDTNTGTEMGNQESNLIDDNMSGDQTTPEATALFDDNSGFGTSTAADPGGFGTSTAGDAGGFGTSTTEDAGGFGTSATSGDAAGFGTSTAGDAGGFGTSATSGDAGGFGTSMTEDPGGLGTSMTEDPGGLDTATSGDAGGLGTSTTEDVGGLGTSTASDAGGFGASTAEDAGGLGTSTAVDAGGLGTSMTEDPGGLGTSMTEDAGGLDTVTGADTGIGETGDGLGDPAAVDNLTGDNVGETKSDDDLSGQLLNETDLASTETVAGDTTVPDTDIFGTEGNTETVDTVDDVDALEGVKKSPEDEELDQLLNEIGVEEETDTDYKSKLERKMEENIDKMMDNKSVEELVNMNISLSKLIQELSKNVDLFDEEVMLEISDRKDKDDLVTTFKDKMKQFAFPCILKVVVPFKTLVTEDEDDVDKFLQMYQYDASLFDYLTPYLLLSEIFNSSSMVAVEDQSEALSEIEAVLLKEKIDDKNNLSMAMVAYMHPSVIDKKHLSSLTDNKLKEKIIQLMNDIIFDKSIDTYNKSVLLDRLSQLIKDLDDNDKLLFKKNVLDMSTDEVEDFNELYSEFVDLEIMPSELRDDTPLVSKKSERKGYCKEIEDKLMQDIREKKPISITEKDALMFNMCDKDNYDKTVETLSKVPDMFDQLKDEIVEEVGNKDTSDEVDNEEEKKEIDDILKSKEVSFKEDLEEQLKLTKSEDD